MFDLIDIFGACSLVTPNAQSPGYKTLDLIDPRTLVETSQPKISFEFPCTMLIDDIYIYKLTAFVPLFVFLFAARFFYYTRDPLWGTNTNYLIKCFGNTSLIYIANPARTVMWCVCSKIYRLQHTFATIACMHACMAFGDGKSNGGGWCVCVVRCVCVCVFYIWSCSGLLKLPKPSYH